MSKYFKKIKSKLRGLFRTHFKHVWEYLHWLTQILKLFGKPLQIGIKDPYKSIEQTGRHLKGGDSKCWISKLNA